MAESKWKVSKDVPGAIVDVSAPHDNLLGLDSEGYAIFMDPDHAALAASAPDLKRQRDELLEALKDLLRDAQDRLTEVPDELYHRCREIINRAEGRS